MCGIAGFLGSNPPDQTNVRATLARMKNRGPDVQNHFTIREANSSVTLLHSRLAIIDLDVRSNQPFVLGDYALVFNGEIYNYQELRANLERQGVRFKTNSDTEVLLL